MRFLIVDDELVNRQLLFQILREYGECDFAENGNECLEKYNQSRSNDTPFDYIFLDIMMPEMDGKEALANIRNWEEKHLVQGKGSKIVMVTAMDDSESVISSFKSGCLEYVVKPSKKEDIIKIIGGNAG